MKHLRFIVTGIIFGIIMTKSEVISWYRIYEMFTFESFHMYGVIGSAVLSGTIIVALIKKYKLKSTEDRLITFTPKDKSFNRYILGGIIFGLGWALTGACPGPMFTLIGNGFLSMAVVIVSATFGTFVYGMIKHKLPH